MVVTKSRPTLFLCFHKQITSSSVCPCLQLFCSFNSAMSMVLMYRISLKDCRIPFLLKVKITQLCPTLCYPIDYTAHGILQARILEWVVVPFSRGLPNPEIEPKSSTLQVDSLPAELPRKPQSKQLTLTQSIFFFNFIGAELIYNVRLVLGIQQSESVICIHIFTFF